MQSDFGTSEWDEAERDLEDAASWYEQQRAGLGNEFLAEALLTFSAIAERPLQYPIVRRNTRRTLTRRFPFGVYLRIETTQIVVIAIMHVSRHQNRLKAR